MLRNHLRSITHPLASPLPSQQRGITDAEIRVSSAEIPELSVQRLKKQKQKKPQKNNNNNNNNNNKTHIHTYTQKVQKNAF